MDIFKEYPDLYEEMIEEKRDNEMLRLLKSVQPTVSGKEVTFTICPDEKFWGPQKSYTNLLPWHKYYSTLAGSPSYGR